MAADWRGASLRRCSGFNNKKLVKLRLDLPARAPVAVAAWFGVECLRGCDFLACLCPLRRLLPFAWWLV
jgi:hypothetical protein